MAGRKVVDKRPADVPKRRPASTPEGREQQIAAAAIDLAEKQILAGTASSQVITHFLKLVSTREQLEQKRLEHEIQLLKAKNASIEAAGRSEKLYKQAINAMREYSGLDPLEQDDDEQQDETIF